MEKIFWNFVTEFPIKLDLEQQLDEENWSELHTGSYYQEPEKEFV